ncbi:MAG: hypothetical protein K5770_07795 [Lachnospiraceae bacterium]|nr:hypothetical protein [Lachnospiraceae bacterium]
MIKKHYSGNARRARNIIWNAAGDYGFEPPFLAFFPDGTPDNYFNMVVGLTKKWLELERLWEAFASYENDRRAQEFDDYLWLGLENCVYEKELPERPMLSRLRKARAEEFFRMQQSLSMQQMELQSMPVYTQQEARWSEVLNKRLLLSSREKRMAEALRFPGELDTGGVLKAMEGFLWEFFHYSKKDAPEGRHRVGMLAKLILKREHKHLDRLIVRAGTGEGDHPLAVQQRHRGMGRYTGPTEEDAAYIRAVFGKSILSEKELRNLENGLCVDEDEGCRLWITGREPEGAEPAKLPASLKKEIIEIRESAEKQRKRNGEFLNGHAAMVQGSIRRLYVRIDTVFSSYRKRLPEPSRSGRLRPEMTYRLPLFSDDRIFLKDAGENQPELIVDLLLDASQSRMHSQEILASEAYIIARGLEKAHIPVRVCAFRSLKAYTVLEVLKKWKNDSFEGILGYFAGGWNRDALAIEALGRFPDASMRGRQRIILVLTDASPNDSTPFAGSGGFLPREYEGAAAVKAAESAVRSLREEGIRVGAVFHGNASHLENAHQIYGHAFVRIQKASQLAQGVSELLLMLMREARADIE